MFHLYWNYTEETKHNIQMSLHRLSDMKYGKTGYFTGPAYCTDTIAW